MEKTRSSLSELKDLLPVDTRLASWQLFIIYSDIHKVNINLHARIYTFLIKGNEIKKSLSFYSLQISFSETHLGPVLGHLSQLIYQDTVGLTILLD